MTFKERLIDLVLQAEALKDMTGPEKTKWVVDHALPYIDIPFVPEWAERMAVEKIVGLIVEKLNWLTGYLFGKILGFLPEEIAARLDKTKLAAVIDAPLPVVAAAGKGAAQTESVDARLQELYDKYGIVAEPQEIPQQETVHVETPEAAPTIATWDTSISFSLQYEGGMNFTVNSDGTYKMKAASATDPGGPTNMGITLPTLANAIRQGVIPSTALHQLTKEQAQRIYKVNFWDKYGWGDLPWPVCACCLDSCIHHGGFAYILQRSVVSMGYNEKVVKIDGKFGPITYGAVKAMAAKDPKELARQICRHRWNYMQDVVAKNKALAYALNGFRNRVVALADLCDVPSPV
jgi:lysozyme family protein